VSIFVVSWFATDLLKRRLPDALASVISEYPELAGHSVEVADLSYPVGAASLVASRTPGKHTPRGRFTHVEGLPIDTEKGAVLLGAEASVADPAVLDGQFFILTATNTTITIVTDPIGYCPIYTATTAEGTLIANNVAVIARALNLTGLDLTCAAEIISATGRLSSSRTLSSGVRKLPGGSQISWAGSNSTPKTTTYFGPQLAFERTRAGSDPALLHTSLLANARALEDTGLPIHAPITAGLDCRFVVAILAAAGVHAKYFTTAYGSPDEVDAIAGREIAELLGLDHTVYDRHPSAVLDRWDEISRRLVARSDGMVSLWQADASMWEVCEVSDPQITLTGLGGEMARGVTDTPTGLAGRRQSVLIERFAAHHAADASGLLTPEALANERQNLRDCAIELADACGDARQVGDLFLVFKRMPAWSGAQSRLGPRTHLRHAPLATRSMVLETFTRSYWHRYGELVHRDAIGQMSPPLAARPSQRGYWRAEGPLGAPRHFLRARLASRTGTRVRKSSAHDPRGWLTELADRYRGQVAGSAESSLWSIVDRQTVEQWLEQPLHLTRRQTLDLFSVLTVLEYDRTLGIGAGVSQVEVESETAELSP